MSLERKYCPFPLDEIESIHWGCFQNNKESAPILGGTHVLLVYTGNKPRCIYGHDISTIDQINARKQDSQDPFYEPDPAL